MRTIVFDARKIRDYGIGTHIQGLLPVLMAHAPRDWRWIVLAPARVAVTDVLPEDLRTRVRWWPTRSRPFGLRMHTEIPALLRAHRADLFHSPYFPLPARLPCPAIMTLHDTILLEPWTSRNGWWKSHIARWIIEWSARRADRVVTVSHTSARQILLHFPFLEDRLCVIPNGLLPEFRLPPPPEVRSLWKTRLRLPDEGYILYVGNDKPHKNLDRLIRACIHLWTSADLSIPLVLTGCPEPSWQRVRRRWTHWVASGRIRWIPFHVQRDALRVVYTHARVLVQPSLQEGFGFPVLEALALGVPVVVSRTGALPEIAGDAGIYFDPTDVSDMARAIHRVLTDPETARHCTDRGRARAYTFTWERAAERFLELYETIWTGRVSVVE